MSDAHEILRLWTRPTAGCDPVEQASLELRTGEGVVGDHTLGRMRHVTIVFADDWAEAERELGREVDPVGRRANVFVSGGDCERLVGHRIRLGEALIEVKGIVAPCPVMEKAAEGLQEALKPGGRPGIWGRVLEGGTVAVGGVLREEPLR